MQNSIRTVIELWPKAEVNTFAKYLDYIKDKYAIIWAEDLSIQKQVQDHLKIYDRQIAFFTTQKDMQSFSKKISDNYQQKLNIKNITEQSGGDIIDLINLANKTFYACDHRHNPQIDWSLCFEHMHTDKHGG